MGNTLHPETAVVKIQALRNCWSNVTNSLTNKLYEGGTSRLKMFWGSSLGVQWLRLHTSSAVNEGSIPGQGTKIQHATWLGQKISKRFKQIPFLTEWNYTVVSRDALFGDKKKSVRKIRKMLNRRKAAYWLLMAVERLSWLEAHARHL